jgi:CxxC-x17-CxxC domain-containing protein
MAFSRDGNDRNSRGGDRGGFRSRPSFGNRPRFGDRGDRGPVEMHRATCDNCGNECEVPFRPTSGKPVYCSNCFEKQKGGSDSRRFEGRSEGRSFERPESRDNGQSQSQPQYREQLDALTIKLDRILQILEPIAVAEVSEELVLESEEPAMAEEEIKVAKKRSSKKS